MPVYIASLVILIVVGIFRGSKSLWVYWLSLAFLFSLLMCDASRFYDLRIDNPHMILSTLIVEFALATCAGRPGCLAGVDCTAQP